MALGQGTVDQDELQADELEPPRFVALQDASHEQALDAIRLDEDECAFGHDPSRRSGDAGSRCSVGVGAAGSSASGRSAAAANERRASPSRPDEPVRVAADDVEGGPFLVARKVEDGRRESR